MAGINRKYQILANTMNTESCTTAMVQQGIKVQTGDLGSLDQEPELATSPCLTHLCD